ncbi:MAG: VOC family protein, partial [Acidobacteria bacterium]|nr:VOC family protein [Acidobacteriota bacterium]
MIKITAVLLVEAIEESLPFWVDRLGFEMTVEVPDGDRLGFVILVRDGAEVMLQTWESARKDAPSLVPEVKTTGASLFIEVPDFEDILRRVAGADIILPERTTFYGMREIGVREPGGHVLIFAKAVAAAE